VERFFSASNTAIPVGTIAEISRTGANFGNVNVGSTTLTPIQMIFMFDPSVNTTLSSVVLLSNGQPSPDFSYVDGSPLSATCLYGVRGAVNVRYGSSHSCKIGINFNPTTLGSRTAVLELLGPNGSVLASASVQGTGVNNVPTVTGITLTASPSNAVVEGQSVTVTAVVTQNHSTTPTGTVQLSVNGLAVGDPVALDGMGMASYTTTTLPVGSDFIKAVYTPDSLAFTTSTSNVLSQVVTDVVYQFSVNIPAGASTSATLGSLGGTATYTFTVDLVPPLTGIPTPVTLSVGSGSPLNATCTLTPTTIAQGTGSTLVTFTVTVPPTTASVQLVQPASQFRYSDALLALLLLPLVGRLRKTGKRLGGIVALLLLLTGGLIATSSLSGCGAGSNLTGNTTSKRYFILVSILGSGPIATSTTTGFTLTVK